MLTLRLLKLLFVGLCLFIIGLVLRAVRTVASVLDRMLMHPFFNAEGLTEEVACMARKRLNLPPGAPPPRPDVLDNSLAYRCVCRLMRRINRLGPLQPPAPRQ